MHFAEGADLVFLTVLFLHIGGAIVAFGPTFAFPIIGALGGKEPQHAGFALHATETIANRLVEPLAVFQGITGVALIAVRGWNVLSEEWLLIAIVIYLITLVFSLFYAVPTLGRLIAAMKEPRPDPTPGSPPPSGPPPHIAELIGKVRRNGQIQTVMLVVIIVLMVYKPAI